MPSLSKTYALVGEARDGDDDSNDANLASLDPLDPRRVSLDIFEVYCHEMVMTSSVGRRAYLIEKMRYMIKRLIGHQYDFGRLYNRTCTANIVARVCGRHAYSNEEDEPIVIGNQSYFIPECLVDFNPPKWKKVIAQFANLRENLLRNDASLTVLPAELDDENEALDDDQVTIPKGDESINMDLGCHADFSKGYENVLNLMRFHLCLSHLQPQLETAIQSGTKTSGGGGVESVVIPRENIIAFESAIGKQFEDDEDSKYVRILSDLLTTKRNKGRQLKSISDLKKIYSIHKQSFDLKGFQYKFLRLIRSWVHLVLPVPMLSQFNYGAVGSTNTGGGKKTSRVVDNKENMNVIRDSDNEKKSPSVPTPVSDRSPTRKRGNARSPTTSAAEEQIFDNALDDDDDNDDEPKPEARGDLKRKRNALMKNVKDPLDDCVAEAQSARVCRDGDSDEVSDAPSKIQRPVNTPSFRKKKASAHSLKFYDSDSETSDNKGIKLSDVPERYQSKCNPQEIQIGSLCPKKRRAKFTDIEDNAIREGVRRFGAGKWSEIKVNYAVELKNRDTVQMKDRWRNMNNKER